MVRKVNFSRITARLLPCKLLIEWRPALINLIYYSGEGAWDCGAVTGFRPLSLQLEILRRHHEMTPHH